MIRGGVYTRIYYKRRRDKSFSLLIGDNYHFLIFFLRDDRLK